MTILLYDNYKKHTLHEKKLWYRIAYKPFLDKEKNDKMHLPPSKVITRPKVYRFGFIDKMQ